jgi:hypothetical protein
MTDVPSYAIYYRGHPACPCQVVWLPAFEHEAQRRGLLRGPLPISQLIGGAAASGNTHLKGGATDFYPLTVVVDVDGFIWLARQMGADATWERPENWDGAGGVRHAHCVLRDCPHNEPARYQYTSTTQGVDHGRDGLSHGGRGAPDPGPRPLSGRTWRQGIEWAKQQEEDDMALSDADKAWIQKTVNDAVEAGFNKKLPNGRSLRAVVQLLAARAGVSDKARRK